MAGEEIDPEALERWYQVMEDRWFEEYKKFEPYEEVKERYDLFTGAILWKTEEPISEPPRKPTKLERWRYFWWRFWDKIVILLEVVVVFAACWFIILWAFNKVLSHIN